MNTKICTTIEQSKKLIELGIDVNTADMYYTTFYGIVSKDLPLPKEVYDRLKYPYPEDKYVSAWSLSALLNLLPKGVSLLKNSYSETYATINTYFGNIEWYEDPIDSAFEMLCWLKENKKI